MPALTAYALRFGNREAEHFDFAQRFLDNFKPGRLDYCNDIFHGFSLKVN
jgi:hypothetical protein